MNETLDKNTFHDALEEVIINIREDNNKEFERLDEKLDKLIDILGKLL